MKSIIVTGASSGIGRATAELFLAEGWRVGLIARRADLLEQMAAEHPNAVALPADVTDAAAVEAAFETFGPLDVLFNNAGMSGPFAPIDEIAVADWEKVMMVNLHGMFLAARQAFAVMRASGGGRIINNGSISATTPRPGSVCYTTTKHAITGLTKSLALDGREFDIACGQIDIGNAETEMVAAMKKISPEAHTMDVRQASEGVLHMANLPPEANVLFMSIMATKMPFVGRG